MKKRRIGLGAVLLLVVIALMGSTTAFAAGYGGHHRWSAGDGCIWADGCRRDADGDGLCDACGRSVYGYVDADGDGVCDHAGAWHTGGGHHGGQGHCRW